MEADLLALVAGLLGWKGPLGFLGFFLLAFFVAKVDRKHIVTASAISLIRISYRLLRLDNARFPTAPLLLYLLNSLSRRVLGSNLSGLGFVDGFELL